MKTRLNLNGFQTLRDELLFWALHCVLDIGSAQISLKGVEFIGQRVASFKTTRERHLLKLIHTLKYAHQLDVLDLKNRLENLNRQSTDLKDQLSHLNLLLDRLSSDLDKEHT